MFLWAFSTGVFNTASFSLITEGNFGRCGMEETGGPMEVDSMSGLGDLLREWEKLPNPFARRRRVTCQLPSKTLRSLTILEIPSELTFGHRQAIPIGRLPEVRSAERISRISFIHRIKGCYQDEMPPNQLPSWTIIFGGDASVYGFPYVLFIPGAPRSNESTKMGLMAGTDCPGLEVYLKTAEIDANWRRLKVFGMALISFSSSA